jgi:HlyD family secretion protein
VVKNQAKADISKAELDARFAREDLKMYLEGEYPNTVKEMEAKIALAAEELQRARQTLEGSRVLFAEKYISQNELQADELAAKKADLDLQLAQEELALFQQYTHQRRVDELQAAMEQAALALERVTRKASADIVQAEADLRAKEAELNQQRDRQTKIEQQIAKTRLVAPRDGLVVYATSTQFSWRGNQDPLAEGQQVRERQDLIYLPTTDTMMVQVKVPEAKIQLLRQGLPATVRVDALPGRIFRGHVSRIAPLPDATSVFLNPDLKVYNTDVLLDESDPVLRTGMSCTVEIVAARYDNAIFVPLHAVLRHGAQPVVYLKNGNDVVMQPVEIGLDNNQVIHITAGLKPGDAVLLNPPLNEAEADTTTPEAPTAPAAPAASAEEGQTAAAPADAADASPQHPSPAPAAEHSPRSMTPEQRQHMLERRSTESRSGTAVPPGGGHP